VLLEATVFCFNLLLLLVLFEVGEKSRVVGEVVGRVLLLLLSRFLFLLALLFRESVTYFCLKGVEVVCVVVDLVVFCLSSASLSSLSSSVISTGRWGFRFRVIVVYFKLVEEPKRERLEPEVDDDDVVDGVNLLRVLREVLGVYLDLGFV